MKHTKTFVTSTVILSLSFLLSSQAVAQIIQTPPARIEPSSADKLFFICKVTPINDDYMNRNKNLWTLFMNGGKFEALKPDELRVISSSKDAAAKDVYEFYKNYAASAFIRGSQYDKGTRPIDKVVLQCAPEPGREIISDAKTLPASSYKKIIDIWDHYYLGLSLLKKKLDNEELVSLVDPRKLPADAFERREEIEKRAGNINKRLADVKITPIILQGGVGISAYDFSAKLFRMTDLKRNTHSYMYTTIPSNRLLTPPPVYDLIISSNLETYTPSTIDDAKQLEKIRAAAAATGGGFKLLTYVQPSGATLNGKLLTIKGIVTSIEVLDAKDKTLFKTVAK